MGKILENIPKQVDSNIIVGWDTSDDAGVFKIRDDLALVQTVDIITPVSDDAYTYGQIAAANALSDVYAMGGRPLTALNICCVPFSKLPITTFEAIIRGALDKIHEAGAVLLGGHTVRDEELKFGLSVSGVVRPDAVITNAGACPGDSLILTKPIGSGVLIDAARSGLISEIDLYQVFQIMGTLNRTPCEVMLRVGANACTDITGFGLAGHGGEIARASGVLLRLNMSSIPLYPRAYDLVSQNLKGRAASAKKTAFFADSYEIAPGIAPEREALLFDPQTSGGLLISVPRQKAGRMLDELHASGVSNAAIIGEVLAANSPGLEVI